MAHSAQASSAQDLAEVLRLHNGRAAHADSDDTNEDASSGGNPIALVLQTMRGRWLHAAGLGILLALIGATVAFFIQKPEYASTGIIQVSANRTGIMYEDRDDSRLRLFDAFVSAEAAYLESRPVLERALTEDEIEDLGWTPDATSFRRLREGSKINRDGGLITVVCKSKVANESAAMVNALLDAYTSLHSEHLRREDSVRLRQLVLREAELLEKLQKLEARIKEVGQEYGVQSIATAHVRKIAQIEEVDVRVAELATTVASREAADSLSEVDTGDVEIKRLVVLDHAMADMLFERTKIAAHAASLSDSLADSHPAKRQTTKALASIDKAIEDRRAQLATLGTTGALTKAGKNAEEESLEGLRALLGRLRQRVEELRGEAIELNVRLIELEFLDSEREQVRELLEQTRSVLEQVRVESQNTLPGTVEIRARGSVPSQPAEDKRKILAAGGGVGGFGAGFCCVLGFGLLFRKFRYSEELASAFPEVNLSGVLPRVDESEGQCDSFANSIHRLRNRVQLSGIGNASQVIVMTGSEGACGVTLSAKTLAESYAASHLKTVVVDADLLTQTLTQQLELEECSGFKDALLSKRLDDAVHLISEGLYALPAGNDSMVEDHRVSQVAVSSLFDKLRNEFQIVIVDAGDFESHLVAKLAAAHADHTILLVPKDQAPAQAARTVKGLQEGSGRLHTVFNFAAVDDAGVGNKPAEKFSAQTAMESGQRLVSGLFRSAKSCTHQVRVFFNRFYDR